MTERLSAQMAIIAHSHGAHVLALFVGSVISALVFAGIVVFEQGGTESSDGETADEDDNNDGSTSKTHGEDLY